MLSEKEVAIIYETLLSSPGMNDLVKLDIKTSRKNVLLLAKIIERGMLVKKGESVEGLLSVSGENALAELQKISSDLLERSGLSAMNEKLQSLQSGGK